MASLRTQNALLFVIALCLVLLVVHFYSGHLVAQAQAAPSDSKEVHLFGCSRLDNIGRCEEWRPVQLDQGGLVTTK